uniref:Uncharacterized protein n=1 Tax=Chaetoceros debilis TaxID=122233 RepID=A0A7S3Q5R2_9STRA|mmetsp:Transcript_28725/g.43912  ORF Transcript_28725/g.43912 Transcript_28725/m.43912 type:complete len:178 (+) Transcript_28725:145-678(+)
MIPNFNTVPFHMKVSIQYYLAVIKYEKSDDYIRTKIEPFLHPITLIVATNHRVCIISTGRKNSNGLGSCFACYYSPPHCWEVENASVVEGVFYIPCGRGNSKFDVYTFIVLLINVICPAIVMITVLTMIYRVVRQSEKNMSKYGVGSLRKNVQKKVQEKSDSDAVLEVLDTCLELGL